MYTVSMSSTIGWFHTWKLHWKVEAVIEITIFPFKIILEITNIIAIPKPSDLYIYHSLITWIFSKFFRIEQRSHSTIIQRIRLHKIHNRKFILHIFSNIRNWKIKPLSMTSCWPICFQNQLILILEQLNSST